MNNTIEGIINNTFNNGFNNMNSIKSSVVDDRSNEQSYNGTKSGMIIFSGDKKNERMKIECVSE